MKTKKLFSVILFSTLFVSLFTSCEKDDEPTEFVPTVSVGMYVLNQGNFSKSNSSLTYYDFNSQTPFADIFTLKNNRGLGATGQDMIKYGSKIYVAMYKSSLIEVINSTTGQSIKQIPMTDNTGAPHSPRCLTSYDGKVYVSLYDGHVAKIDTSTLSVDGLVAVGSNPEAIITVNNKIYVANSGGMAAVNDSTISIIDPSTFTVTGKIKVVINPVVLKADKYGDLYVISMGNYADIPYTLQRIDTKTNTVTTIPDVNAYNLAIYEDKAYIYYYIRNYTPDYSSYTESKSFTLYDVKNEKVLNNKFIADGVFANIPYSIDVDPVTKNIFIGETDYSNTGKMYCFGDDGSLKYTFGTGVNPAKSIFLNK